MYITLQFVLATNTDPNNLLLLLLLLLNFISFHFYLLIATTIVPVQVDHLTIVLLLLHCTGIITIVLTWKQSLIAIVCIQLYSYAYKLQLTGTRVCIGTYPTRVCIQIVRGVPEYNCMHTGYLGTGTRVPPD